MKLRVCFVIVTMFIHPMSRGEGSSKGWIKSLRSLDRAESFIAQAYVARAGAEVLPALEKLAHKKDRALGRHLKEVINLMLRNTVAPHEIQKHRRLWQLLEPELAKAAIPYHVLANQKDYDSGEVGLLMPGESYPISAPRLAVEELIALRGFGVPAALDLLADKQPGSRMYGVEIIGRLDAIAQLSALQSMLQDRGAIEISGGCYLAHTTVGAETPRWLAAGALGRAMFPHDEYAAELETNLEAWQYLEWLGDFERVGSFDLVKRLHREGRIDRAASWDDYWSRARPVLEVVLGVNQD